MSDSLPASPTATAPPRRALGLSILALIGLAALGVPRVIFHDLHLVDEASVVNWILALGPIAVWVAVAVIARVPRPFLTVFVIGAMYGVMVVVTHQVLWGSLYADAPAAAAGLSRLAVVPGGLFAGVLVGAIGGLIAWGIRAVTRRTARPR